MMTESKPWYLSRTVWASIVALALSMAGLLGVDTGTVDPAGLTETLLQAATAIATLIALVGRIAAKRKLR